MPEKIISLKFIVSHPLRLVVQEKGVKQIQNSGNKQDVVNIIVEIPFLKHLCYLQKEYSNPI